MITTVTVTMILFTYTNAFTRFHMTFSEHRVDIAIMMGSAMANIMLGLHVGGGCTRTSGQRSDHRRRPRRGGTALWLSRSQTFLQGETYMKSIIPHHSIARLTSERSQTGDVRVRKLADEIIKAQRIEIDEMKWR